MELTDNKKMKYVLFDNDGTVTDSEGLAMGVAADNVLKEAKSQGVTIARQEILDLFGKSLSLIQEYVTDKYGVSFPQDFARKVHKETVKVLGEKAQGTPGIKELLEDMIAAGMTPVMVTSSELDRVVAGLKAAGLKKFFPDHLIFSATSTLKPPQPKPLPAIYDYALQELRIRAKDTATFEDSSGGATSAKDSGKPTQETGVPCYGYLGASHVQNNRRGYADKLLKAGVKNIIYHWDEIRPVLGLPPHRQNPKPTPSIKLHPAV